MVYKTDEEEARIPEGKPFRGPLKGPRCVVTGPASAEWQLRSHEHFLNII